MKWSMIRNLYSISDIIEDKFLLLFLTFFQPMPFRVLPHKWYYYCIVYWYKRNRNFEKSWDDVEDFFWFLTGFQWILDRIFIMKFKLNLAKFQDQIWNLGWILKDFWLNFGLNPNSFWWTSKWIFDGILTEF